MTFLKAIPFQTIYISDPLTKLSDNEKDIANCNVFIITVPTPVDINNKPVLTPLLKASETVGSVLKTGDIVIYESTVYPGATEEDCIPEVHLDLLKLTLFLL